MHYIQTTTRKKKQKTHTFKPQPRKKPAENKTKKNNCQNKIRTIVFNKNDNKPVFSLWNCHLSHSLSLNLIFSLLSPLSDVFCRSPRFAALTWNLSSHSLLGLLRSPQPAPLLPPSPAMFRKMMFTHKFARVQRDVFKSINKQKNSKNI